MEDALSAGAQKAVTLTDLCKSAGVTPALFVASVLKADMDRGHIGVLTALLHAKDLPPDVELAISEKFTVRKRWGEASEGNPVSVG